MKLLPQRHMSFDIDFDDLIQKQDHENDAQRFFQSRKTLEYDAAMAQWQSTLPDCGRKGAGET